MKILILSILLMAAGAVLAVGEAESGESAEQVSNTRGSSPSFFSQQASHSVINSNGNSVVVSRRFNAKGKEESYISIASPKIRIDGEYFTCSSLTCPAEAFKCHVSSEAIADDRNSMKTIAECLDKDGKVLEARETIEENPYPREEPPYSRVADVDRDGSINVQDSNGAQSFTSIRRKLTKEEQEKLEKDLAEQQRHTQELIKKQLDELNNHFHRVFGPQSGFPFGNNNPFGNNFPFGGNNPYAFGTNYGNPFRSTFDSFGGDAGFGFRDNNWPFVSSYGFHPFSSYPPVYPNTPVTNQRFPYTPNPHDDHIPESFDTNRHSLTPAFAHRPPSDREFETNTELDAENELYETTTYRGSDNNVMNYYDKYRYAHSN